MVAEKEDPIKACENAIRFLWGSPVRHCAGQPEVGGHAQRPQRAYQSGLRSLCRALRMRRGPRPVCGIRDKALVENAVKLMYRSVYVDLEEWCSMTWSRSTWQSSNLWKSSMRNLTRRRGIPPSAVRFCRRETVLRPLPGPLSDETADDCHGPAQRLRHAERSTTTVCRYNMWANAWRWSYDTDTIDIFHGFTHVATHHRNDTPVRIHYQAAPNNLPGRGRHEEVTCRSSLSRAAVIDNIVKSLPACGHRRQALSGTCIQSVPWHHEPGEKVRAGTPCIRVRRGQRTHAATVSATWWTSSRSGADADYLPGAEADDRERHRHPPVTYGAKNTLPPA